MAHSNDGADSAAGTRPNGRRSTSHSTTPSAAVLTPPTGLPAVEPTAPPRIPAQRIPAPAGPGTPSRPVQAGVRLCACGHPEEMHEHYRSGTDCGACGARACGSFRLDGDDRPVNPIRRLLRRRRG
ncbi:MULTISPECIES: hypothetical protein [Pseudonocardia]|uniref:Uncharacterized protein n=2 Tax=Pseudonocardia TaxID=1847 RepID=A0A1Y2N890_PSEAH|nr:MULTISPECIES: hypothetical protein [Pseudonocardia]OSY43680.1 hypothetical protein BG845_00626 [Pseudonocardia autotrophica]TDN73330.1 hypothetical protein C8E95_2423 [Pseudonocardia autotrophica]BBG04068.1 hypothetical protein Pdca_52770 [Pseudonocardia autotrophica]GEC26205.1 hypothetical protein PSA01_32340 [Pseudonocardia saturnea]